MFIILISLLYLSPLEAASTGAKSCDALGVCARPQSGARVIWEGNLNWNMRLRYVKANGLCSGHVDDPVDTYPVNADDPTNLFKTFCCNGNPNAEPSTCLNPSNVAQAFDGSNAQVNGTDFCNEPVTYDEAEKFCRERGERLCTREELLAPTRMCCGKGCSASTSSAWTSTSVNDAHQVGDDILSRAGWLYDCPYGMHMVGHPTRSDDYEVIANVERYTPGQLVEIKLKSKNPVRKILGILMYAVVDDGIIGVSGGGGENCQLPGCLGINEVKIGEWVTSDADDHFHTNACGASTITHQHAQLKKYTETFYWKAPPSGSGDVIFRVIVKQGSTNGGYFYWPMTQGDLTLQEGSTSDGLWFTGPASKSCSDICLDNNQGCNGGIIPTVDIYDTFKSQFMCHGAPVSTCNPQFPTRDSHDQCFFYNQASAQCETPMHYFTCCRDGDDQCWTPCRGLRTRAEAMQYCADHNRRLCTRAELDRPSCCTKSQECNNEYSTEMWTLDTYWDCQRPAEQICDQCNCHNELPQSDGTTINAKEFNRLDRLNCIQKTWDGETDNGEFNSDRYTYFFFKNSTQTGGTEQTDRDIDLCGPRPDAFCDNYIIQVPGSQVGQSVWKIMTEPPTKVSEDQKCGTTTPVEGLLDGINCLNAALDQGIEWFSWNHVNGLCVIPESNSECVNNATYTDADNYDVWRINKANCHEKVYVKDSCSGVTFTRNVTDALNPPTPSDGDLCNTKHSVLGFIDGENRICQCNGQARYASHDTEGLWIGMWSVFGAICICCCCAIICINDCRSTASFKNPYLVEDKDRSWENRGSVSTYGVRPPSPPAQENEFGFKKQGSGLPRPVRMNSGLPKRNGGLPPRPPKRVPEQREGFTGTTSGPPPPPMMSTSHGYI